MPLTTPGRLMLAESLPSELYTPGEVIDKKKISSMMQTLAERMPDRYVDVLQDILTLSREAAYRSGHLATVSPMDLVPPPEVRKIQSEMRADVRKIAQDPGMSPEDKNKAIADYVMSRTRELPKTVTDAAAGRNNRLALAAKLGLRGNADQFQQIIFGDAMNADFKGRAIPIPAFTGYGQGVSPLQYWSGAYSARKGDVDTQFATADTGFFSKSVATMAQNAVVTEDDCGTANGVVRQADDPDVVGAVLARDAHGYKAGQIVTRSIAKALKDSPVVVRSTMSCQAGGGVCRKCAGIRDARNFPEIGSYLGIEAGRIATEPLTQGLALNSRHVGGTAGVNEKNMGAFQEINQFVNTPENFVGGAALAPVDGKVTRIEDAPQGGWYVHVGGERVYADTATPVTVKVGQSVEAGDALSSGMLNLRTYAGLRGVGEARKMFADGLHAILKEKGQGTSRKNVDVLARELVNRVRITDPDGVSGYEVGEEVSYDDLARKWQPRDDTREVPAAKGVGGYLQQPALHYTIGTRVTPSVAAALAGAGYNTVAVSAKAPGFEPVIQRMIDIPSKDPDWITRLSGWNVKRGFVDAVQRGLSSKPDSMAYARKMYLPEELGEDDEQ